MAIFQPSNVIPSTFAGIGGQTVDVSDKIIISWQVNGNSPMTAFRIQLYKNSTNVLTKDTGVITLDTPFYGVDKKGNPKQFSYEPSDTLWSSWGLSNDSEYKMIITQYWGTNNANSIVQYSGSVFLTRQTPTVTINYSPALEDGKSTVAKQAFSASISPETALNSVRWQFGKLDGTPSSTTSPVSSDLVTILDDTGAINTNVLEYEVTGLLGEFTYAINCIIETVDGVETETGWQAFGVTYTQPATKGGISTACLSDDSVLLSWGNAITIEGEMSPTGATPEVTDSELHLAEGQSVTWDKTNKTDDLAFSSPWSMAWKGKIAKVRSDSYSLTAEASRSSATSSVTTSESNFRSGLTAYANDGNNAETFQVYGNGKWVRITETGDVYTSTSSHKSNAGYWKYETNLFNGMDGSVKIIGGVAYGNSYFVAIAYFVDTTYGANFSGYFYSSSGNSGSWTYVTTSIAGQYIPLNIVYGGGYFVILRSSLYDDKIDLIYIKESYIATFKFSDTIYTGTESLAAGALAYGNNEWLVGCFKNGTIYKFDSSFEYTGKVKVATDALCIWDIAYNPNAPTYKYIALVATTALGNAYDYYISKDGVSWSQRPLGIGVTGTRRLAVGGGFTVMALSSKLLISNDNEVWETVTRYTDDFYRISCDGTTTYPLFRITGSDSSFFEIMPYYITTTTVSARGWLYTYSIGTQSGIYYASASQSSYDGNVTLSVTSYKGGLTATFYLTMISDTSTASQVIPFTAGALSTAKIISITPSVASSSLSISGNNMTINLTMPTPSRYTPSTAVTVEVCEIYDEVLSADSNTLIETDKFLVALLKTKNTDGLYIYSVNVKDVTTGDVIGYSVTPLSIPSEGQSYDLYGTINLTQDDVHLYLSSKAGDLSKDSEGIWSSTVQNENITSIKLRGEQVCDWLYVSSGDTVINSSATPKWLYDTLFFADFSEEDDYLQAGTVASGASLSNVLYRSTSDKDLADVIAELPPSVNMVKDYGMRSGEQYSWELYYLNGAEAYSNPIESESVCRQFRAYTLMEAKQDETYPNTYHVVKVWRFENNLSVGDISNNNSPNWLTNFTKYRLRQPSSLLGQSGTLQALLSNYNQSENFYIDTVKKADELKNASASTNTFFLKDMKGNLYMVGISGAITQTVNIKSKVQEITVSVPWEEVGDASNVSLIQLPTDEGWEQDEVMNVMLDTDTKTELLSVKYPQDYYGTTFLLATTPIEVDGQVDLSLESGAVKAVKTLRSGK